MGIFRRRDDRREAAAAADSSGQTFRLGEFQRRVEERMRAWDSAGFLRRLWAKDPSLWPSDKPSDIVHRLGWLDLPRTMEGRVENILAFAREIRSDGLRHAVVLGMGGSSLAPEVYQRTFGNSAGSPELIVLDSTHPAAIAAVERKIDLERTLFIFSSKSGTTIEPLSFFRYFWELLSGVLAEPGERFIAVTDPGTHLAALGREKNFRRVFEAAPNVGGRFSALTEFGLVPAALIGLDIRALLAGALAEAEADGPDVPAGTAPGLRLGAALGEIGAVRDKLTLLTSPSLRGFPDWLEQLVAESMGKHGKGIVPVPEASAAPAGFYGRDRMFASFVFDGDPAGEAEQAESALEAAGHPVVRIRLAGAAGLGREIFRWEIAVAAAGAALGINPFDQPDVELAKVLARKAMARTPEGARRPAAESEDVLSTADPDALKPSFERWLASARPGDYISVQAYLGPGEETRRALDSLRLALGKKTGLAATAGFGPRFLHSTGQLHKGGPDEALVLQLIDEAGPDLAVPETDFTFGTLIKAQALGDYRALKQRGRRALRIDLKANPAAGIARLEKWLPA